MSEYFGPFIGSARSTKKLQEKYVFGVSQTLTFVRWIPRFGAVSLKPNGPAIKAVCVGRRKCRPPSVYFSQEAITAQGGHGAVFGMVVQLFGPIRVSRYKFDRNHEFITGYKVCGGH